MLELAYEHNNNSSGYFKTVGLVCGAFNKSDSTYFKKYWSNTEIKLWHGANDNIVGVWPDRNLVALFAKIPSLKNHISYKEYSGWAHNIWLLSYAVTPKKENEKIQPPADETYWAWLEYVSPYVKPGSVEAGTVEILDGKLARIRTENNVYELAPVNKIEE